MTKLPTKYRPKRVFKNKKGYYFLVNKKKRYIKLGEDISEKKLINIIIYLENYETHENHTIPLENHENHENHRIPCENNEIH